MSEPRAAADEPSGWTVEALPIHGWRILDENGRAIVRDVYSEEIARQIVFEHNAVGVLMEALRQIAPRRRCEHFTNGIGACFLSGRTVDAVYVADKCCASCIAYAALDRINGKEAGS